MGLRYLLMQHGNVVTYASMKHKVHQREYTTHDLELVAVVFALKLWRHYLYGFMLMYILTKRVSNTCLLRMSLISRQTRWLKLWKKYVMGVLYHLGKANVVVDALSLRTMGSCLIYGNPRKT